jgi:hypothetical protein
MPLTIYCCILCRYIFAVDWADGAADEDGGSEAHHHGGTLLRDAAADVVRVRFPALDDVVGWRARLCVQHHLSRHLGVRLHARGC